MRLPRPAFYSALGSCLLHALVLSFTATLIVSRPQPSPPSVKVTLVERPAPLPVAEGATVKERESKPVEKPALLPPSEPKPIPKSRRKPSPPKKMKLPPVAPPPTPEPPKASMQVPAVRPVEEAEAVVADVPAPPTDASRESEGGTLVGGKASTAAKSGGGGGQGQIAAQPDYGVNPKPPYPMLARRLGAQGVVLLRVHVRKDGTVADVELARSSGFAMLDDAATRTVLERWRFVPARVDGVPVASWVEVPIRFVLEGS